jgi:predicted secreted acid phosphatase
MNIKRINYFLVFSTIVIVAVFSACTSAGPNIKNDNDLLMGVLWQQNSGEYAALCYQAFNAGKMYIDTLSPLENRVVQKLQFLNNFRLKIAKCGAFCRTCSRTNRVLEQV